MALAFESVFTTAPREPRIDEQVELHESCLNIVVVFTSVDATLAALKEAVVLASRLCGRVTLIVPQLVPYPLPLTSPPVLLDWNERRFRLIATDSPVEMKVMIYLCRDRKELLSAVLEPHSVVVLGGHNRWWPTRATWLARTLRRAGHEVIFKVTE